MANSPQKSKDPTELALSAIEEALNVRDLGREPEAERADEQRLPPAAEQPAHWPRAPQVEADSRPAPSAPDETLAPRIAANDDRESVGQVLRALQRRPSRAPFLVAWLFTIGWAVLFAAMAFGTYSSQLGDMLSHGTASAPVVLGLAAAFVAPVMLFFVVAHLFSRAQELRLVGQSMAEIAIRLAEPETVARDSIVSVGQAVRREVAAIGDGVERALARASELESIVNEEVATLERAYTENETRMRSLIEGIVSQRQLLLDQAEQVRTAISNVHIDLSNEISAVSDMVSQQVGDAAQRITGALGEKSETITKTLQNSGDTMIAALGERGSELISRLEQASAMTTQAIDAASERMAQNLTFKTDHIQGEFAEIASNVQHMMASRLDQVADEFSQKALAVVDTMDERARSINQALVENSGMLAETIVSRADEVNNTLKATGDSLVLDLSLRGSDVVNRLEQTGNEIAAALTASGARVAESVQHNAEALTASVSRNSEAMRDLLTQRLAAFEEMFSRSGTELAERISRDSSSLGALITRHLNEFDYTVKTYGGELAERIGQRTQEVSETLRENIENFDSRVTAKVGDVTTILDGSLDRFHQAIEARARNLNDTLSARVGDIAKSIADGSREAVAALDQRVETIRASLSGQSDAIAARLVDLSKTISEDGKGTIAALDQRIEAIGNTINSRGDAIAARLGEKIQDFDRTVGAQAAQVAANFDQRIGRFEHLLLERAESLLNEIESRGHNAAAELNSVMQALAANATQAEQAINTLSGTVSTTLKQNAAEVERTLLNVSTQVSRNIVSKSDEAAAALAARSNELTRLLDDKNGVLVNAIGLKTIEMTSELERITDQAAHVMDSKGQAFARSLRENSQDIAQKINEASERAIEGVGKALREIEATATGAVENARRTATATVAEILETNGMLRTDTTALFERLREANGVLQEVLSNSQSNLNTIEHVLSTRVTDFVGVMNTLLERTGHTTSRMDEHIGGFYDVTGRVLANLNDLSSRFDQQGRDLADVAAQLDASNRQAERAVAERRNLVESLVGSLDARTEDLDARLRRFSSLLDESLAAAEDRARDIARTIADSSSSGARAVAEQFQAVREATDEERRRTLEALRHVYEEANGEAQAMFQSATDRFAEVMRGMKQMAADMQRELDATRAELRRGILELPQETAESAAQMRRVIVDQIEALAELNRIVARHGRELENVEPAPRRAAALREDTATASPPRIEAPRISEPPSRAEVRSEPRTPYPSPVPPLTPAPRRSTGAESYAPPPKPGAAPQTSDANQANWLSELLSRASREGEALPPRAEGRSLRAEERPTRHTIESLDSLSVDIARMIDHDAAAELWDRYNRGERNVFTRKLYTMQGQRAFEEIRRRYRNDREFKQTVDRYIAEFERLLGEVSRDDRGQVVARTYLTSETGKVYTMLAHAAGRIE